MHRQNLIDLKATLHRPDSGFKVAPFDFAIAEELENIPRDQIPDMPDRMIAATAQHLSLPLVTTDYRIQQSDVETIGEILKYRRTTWLRRSSRKQKRGLPT